MKKWLLMFLVQILLVIISLEVGLYLIGPFKRAGKTPDNVLWQVDTEIGFAPAKDLDITFYTNEWINEIRTNEFGFRIPPTAFPLKQPISDAIMFLGDSQTMAVQVPVELTYVSLVEDELARRKQSMRVVNAGCNGFNTVQEYLFFQKLYKLGMQPQVVVVYVVNNDLFEDVQGLPYGHYSLDSQGYLDIAPPDPESLARLRRAKETPAPKTNFWLSNSAFLRHLWYLHRIIRNPHDVANWVRNCYLRDDLDTLAANRWAVATAALRSLNRLVSSYGGKLVIAVHPDPVEWSDAYYSKMMSTVPELSGNVDRMKLQHGYRRIAENVGAHFIDMLQGFPNISVREFRYTLDPHCNIPGHRIIASQLLKGLDQIGILSKSSKGR